MKDIYYFQFSLSRLWEIIWANPFCQNFHLLICLALLHSEKHTIMENRFGLTEILKHINDLAYNIDVNSVVTKAEAIFLKLNQAEENVPSKILDIIHGRLDCDDGDRTPEEAEEATEARTDGSRSDTGETTS